MPSMRLNTTAKADKNDTSEWHTVKSKAEIQKAEAAQKQAAQKLAAARTPMAVAPKAANGASKGASKKGSKGDEGPLKPIVPGGSIVLAALDRQWAQQQALRVRAGTQDLPIENGFAGLEEPEAPVQQAKPVASPSPEQDAKQKKPKKKKEAKKKEAEPAEAPQPKAGKGAKARAAAKPVEEKKVTVASLAKAIDVAGFQDFVDTMVAKHPSDELLQMQLVQDFLRSVFATADLPHSALLASSPISEVADTPWTSVPGPLRQVLGRFVAAKSRATLSEFTCRAVEMVVTGLPERGTGGPPARVDALLMLAAVLRKKPGAALVPACDTLSKMGSRILAPGRMPTFLWVLEQATRGGNPVGRGAAMHAWCRVVLPGLVMTDIPCSGSKAAAGKGPTYQVEGAARDAAVAFAHAQLSRSADPNAASDGAADAPGGGKDAKQHVAVPAAATVQVGALVSGDVTRATVPRDTLDALAGLQEPLSRLAVSCGSEAHINDLVTRTLDAAGTCPDASLQRHADTLVRLVKAQGPKASASWSSRHKANIKGSSRVLECLAESRSTLAPLVATPEGQRALLATLTDIDAKQATLVGSAKPTAARACALRARSAIETLSASNSVQGAGGSAMISVLGLLGACAFAVHYVARNPEQMQSSLEGVLGSDAARTVIHYCQETVVCMTTHVPAAVDTLTARVRKALA